MRKWSAVPVLTCFTVLALNIYAQSPPKPTAAVSVPRGRTLTFTLGSRIPANAPGVLVVDEQGPVSGVSARFAAGKLTVTTSPTSPPGRYLLALDMPIGAVATQVEVRVVTSRREADDLVREYNEAEAARKLANQQAFGEGWEKPSQIPPDSAVINLDAAAGRSLLRQITSNSFSGPALGKLQQIAARSTDPLVKAAAIEALKRSPDSRARGLLPTAHRSTQTDAQRLAALDRELASSRLKILGTKPIGLAATRIDVSKITLPPPPVAPVKDPGHWWAVKAMDSGVTPAQAAELANPGRFRQIFILPVGYQSTEFGKFEDDVKRTVMQMGNVDSKPHVTFSSKYKDQIVYISQWHPGAALDALGRASFSGKLFTHPTRGGKAVSVDQEKIFQTADAFRASKLSTFAPLGVLGIFNCDENVTANASPPTFLIPDLRTHTVKDYGIARITRYDIASKVPMHEVAHACLNWLDEYFEDGLKQIDIFVLDPLSPLVQLDNSWPGGLGTISRFVGIYDFRISECMADNGADNIAPRRIANTVGSVQQVYGSPGGMFFGLGVWKEAPSTVMNGGYPAIHPSSHQQVLKQAFEGARAGRANDRLRNAGPITDWALGATVQLMMHDGDKHHRWHPTQQYEVEVGWYEKEWKTCPVPNSTFTYPCWVDTWKSFSKKVTPQLRMVDLGRLLNNPTIAQILYHLGMDNISAALPTLKWPVPYQEVDVTVPNMFQNYWWRFRTYNGAQWSDFTGWSNFRRVL